MSGIPNRQLNTNSKRKAQLAAVYSWSSTVVSNSGKQDCRLGPARCVARRPFNKKLLVLEHGAEW